MNIAVITSGGDSPGMNPCVADLTLEAGARGHKLYGFVGGYSGIRDNLIKPLEPCDVRGWHKLGGSKLRSGRLPELENRDMRLRIISVLKSDSIDALIVLGGDGSLQGAKLLSEVEPSINFIGIPCSIDNDITGSDYSLGHDTALNKLVTYIDDITDTALSMNPRVFVIETLGGPYSCFAQSAVKMGICDLVITESHPLSVDEICKRIITLTAAEKMGYALISVSEAYPNLSDIIQEVQSRVKMSVKYNNIAYQQRGGAPTALERLHAAGFARLALDAAEKYIEHKYVIYCNGQYGYGDLSRIEHLSKITHRVISTTSS